jgi:hypothetical protein
MGVKRGFLLEGKQALQINKKFCEELVAYFHFTAILLFKQQAEK